MTMGLGQEAFCRKCAIFPYYRSIRKGRGSREAKAGTLSKIVFLYDEAIHGAGDAVKMSLRPGI